MKENQVLQQRIDGLLETLKQVNYQNAMMLNWVTGAVLIFRNLTEQRLKEANRIHSMKLESIGELAAGIAHEINTPIQFIGSNLSFLKDSFQDLQQLVVAYGRLREAVGGLAQCQEIVREIADLEEQADPEYLQEEIPQAFDQTVGGVERVTKLVQGSRARLGAGAGDFPDDHPR